MAAGVTQSTWMPRVVHRYRPTMLRLELARIRERGYAIGQDLGQR
jgi:hypothetical protein